MSYEAQVEHSNVQLAFVFVRRYAKKCGASAVKVEARMAAIVVDHSDQTFMSVTRLRRSRLAWQHKPSVSTSQISGTSSQILTYSFTTILKISFSGTELKPGRCTRFTNGPGLAGVVATADGHAR